MSAPRLALVGVLACLAGCLGPAPAPPPATPAWSQASLPETPAEVVLADLTRCAGSWYAAGALRDPDGATRPALWSSPDGRSWADLPVAPTSYYGRQQVLYSIDCRDGVVAALGSKAGGVHGNPRISSWRSTGAGLTEVDAPIELYGGPRAITVKAIAARSSGWLIAGNRTGRSGLAGAAVWLSPDAAGFVLHADALGLASSPEVQTSAHGVVAGRSDWVVYGDVRDADSVLRQPAVWGSTGGLVWARAALPRTPGDGSVTALAVQGGRMLAAGTQDAAIHAWYFDGSGWSDAGGPPTDRPQRGVATVGDVTMAERDAYAAVDDGTRWTLWAYDLRTWRAVSAPATPASGADSRLLLAGSDDQLVVADSGPGGSHLWTAPRRVL